MLQPERLHLPVRELTLALPKSFPSLRAPALLGSDALPQTPVRGTRPTRCTDPCHCRNALKGGVRVCAGEARLSNVGLATDRFWHFGTPVPFFPSRSPRATHALLLRPRLRHRSTCTCPCSAVETQLKPKGFGTAEPTTPAGPDLQDQRTSNQLKLNASATKLTAVVAQRLKEVESIKPNTSKEDRFTASCMAKLNPDAAAQMNAWTGGALNNLSNGLPPPPPQAGPRVPPGGTGGPPRFSTSASFGVDPNRIAPAGSMVATRTGSSQDACQLHDGSGAAALQIAAANAAAVGSASASGCGSIDLTALGDNSPDGCRKVWRTSGSWCNPGSARSNSSNGEEDYTSALTTQHKDKFLEVMDRRRARVKEVLKAATRWKHQQADRASTGKAEHDKNKRAVILDDAARCTEVKTLWGSKHATLDTVVSLRLANMDSTLMKLLDMSHCNMDALFSALWGWAETVGEMKAVWIPGDIDPPPSKQDLNTSADYDADGFDSIEDEF